MAKILIVEDNEQVVATFTEFLEIAGHEVESVGSVVDALNKVVDFQPDLILLDLSLGNENVGGTVGAFALKGLGFRGKIVVVTGGMDTTKPPLRDIAPVNGVLLKPITSEELLSEVARQLGERDDDHETKSVS